jgi:hypothetical protein
MRFMVATPLQSIAKQIVNLRDGPLIGTIVIALLFGDTAIHLKTVAVSVAQKRINI